jgi:hypothetical protein
MARKAQPRIALSVAAAQSLPNRTNKSQLHGVYDGQAVRRRECCHDNSLRDPSPQVVRANHAGKPPETARAAEVAPALHRPEPYWQSGRGMRYDPLLAKTRAKTRAKNHAKEPHQKPRDTKKR